MELLKRKIDTTLAAWKENPHHLPLIVKGARQIGKTFSIMDFARKNYSNVIALNFALQSKFKAIFDDGCDVPSILRNLSLLDPSLKFVPGETLLFFDEMQQAAQCATSLKAFALDGRFDVICSGSLMGINYAEIESNSVGYKEDFQMFSMDFEEFLWAKGYSTEFLDELYQKMLAVKPLTSLEMEVMMGHFRDYMMTGGMPAVVSRFLREGNFSGSLSLQQQLLRDYEEDITKYAGGLDKGRILNIYRNIAPTLARENKKFQISKVRADARSRDYTGVVEWLSDAGIVNPCYCLASLSLPLKGNYFPDRYKLYYGDTGLLVASLDEEAQEDLRVNRNFGTYRGALFENIIAETLVKQGLPLYYYANEKSTVEMGFMVRDIKGLVPVEVKASDNGSRSLTRLTKGDLPEVDFGVKFANQNIGFNGHFYTFPYFLSPFLKRFLREKAR